MIHCKYWDNGKWVVQFILNGEIQEAMATKLVDATKLARRMLAWPGAKPTECLYEVRFRGPYPSHVVVPRKILMTGVVPGLMRGGELRRGVIAPSRVVS